MTDTLDWPRDGASSVEAAYDGCAEIYDVGIGIRSTDRDFYVGEARQAAGEGGELIELGTGTGRMAEWLVGAGFRVIGVDVSARMLAIAGERAGRLGGKYRVVHADMRTLDLGAAVPLVIAPFGTVGHLLSEADFRAALRVVLAHLRPGGAFVFDDSPSWLHPPRSAELERVHEQLDPVTGLTTRLLTNFVDLAGGTQSLGYFFLDQLEGSRLVRRSVTQLMFNNPPLGDLLAWVAEAGFDRVEVLGSFDGRAFVRGDPGANERMIVRCRKPG